MTITTVTARNTFAGNGSTLPFNTDYQFFDASDLVVTLVVDATGVEATQALTTDYTVSGGAVNNAPATGTVTMIVAPATGETLVIERVQPFTQGLIDLLTGGKFPAATIEAGYDRVTLLVQQVLDTIRRSPQVPKTTDPTAISPIIPVPVADEILVGKSATEWEGKTIGALSPSFVTVPISIANGGTNATNEAAARTNLAVPGTGVINTFTKTQTWAKGADIASASPLVLGTDGNYFDVTGTTGFSQITVVAGTFFMLQFDGALVLTHGASLDLPTEANITTVAGDRLIGFAEATNTVQVLSYVRASGASLVASGLAQVVYGEDVTARTTTDTTITYDDTIPQSSEGVEAFTQTITPTAAGNDLIIEVTLQLAGSAAGIRVIAALFKDSDVNALASATLDPGSTAATQSMVFRHKRAAGDTSAQVYKIRWSVSTGTASMNRTGGSANNLGDTIPSSITIWEVKP